MKTRIGNKTVSLPKEVVVAHMANLISTKLVFSDKEKNFKHAFTKYKDLVEAFLRENKRFVFSFSDEKWVDKFNEFQEKQLEIMFQDVVFKFSDGSSWSIPLMDIANLKMLQEPEKKHTRIALMSAPLELVTWAQEELSWDQISSFAVLRQLDSSQDIHKNEWKSVQKSVIRWHYELENESV
jgi:hypothetical protein